jgi:aspartate racemase
MYEVGRSLGLGKVEAGALAEELMVAGLVELKTLAGAITITADGLRYLGLDTTVTKAPGMKTIGLLGGMSWESTLHYYRLLNEAVKAQLGGLHSAKIVLISVDFHSLEKMLHDGNWTAITAELTGYAQQIEKAGAEMLLVCTNTMHKVADAIQTAITIPLIHIADCTADRIAAVGLRKVGLLGTRFTMEEDFYRHRLARRHGLEVIVPEPADRKRVDEIIFTELCRGLVREESRKEYLRIIADLQKQGATGIIAGCTEIGMLVEQHQLNLPFFETTEIHAEAAIRAALLTR